MAFAAGFLERAEVVLTPCKAQLEMTRDLSTGHPDGLGPHIVLRDR